MGKYLNRIIFIGIIVLIIYVNKKLNNLIGIGYFGCIKYFFIFLSIIFVVYPDFDKEYIKFKEKYIK
jgi:hypothetical protein